MQVNVHDAKTNLSKLLEKLATGEESEITIARAGTPIAKLISYAPTAEKRVLGTLSGHTEYWEASDCWEPDEELIDLSINGPIFPEKSEETSTPPLSALMEDPVDDDEKPPENSK
jgi:prevent-host-death family protein